MKRGISVRGTNGGTKLNFKNNASLRSSVSKIINTFVGNAEYLDIVMSMYNLLEYCDNYSMASPSLWNYHRDEVNDDTNENNPAGNYRINNNKTTTGKSFECRTKITGKTQTHEKRSRLDTVIVS